MGDLELFKEKILPILKSNRMIVFWFFLKMITYYVLIEVNIFSNISLIYSIVILTSMFVILSHSRKKRKKGLFLSLYSFFSIIMFSDAMYYNYYNQTVSIKQLWQLSNVAKVPQSFVATFIPATILLLIDIPFIYYYFKQEVEQFKLKKAEESYFKRVNLFGVALIFLLVFTSINPLKSSFVTRMSSVEFFSYHINDVVTSIWNGKQEKVIENTNPLKVIEKYKTTPVSSKYKEIAQGRNVIVVQIEALQNFLIHATYEGQELTPNLNRLIEDNSLYFDNYYSTIGKGNTVDAEFVSMNSIYPVIDREVYTLYEQNTFYGLPWMLKDLGYQTMAIHGYEGDFWNRRNAYPEQGFDQFYAMEDLDATEQIGLGISDESMFRQAVDIMKDQKGNFLSFIITLTNHHPFELNDDTEYIKLLDEHKGTKFGKYLQTVYYTDMMLGKFIDECKAAGIYNNSVFAFYGDHHGLNFDMDDNDKIVGDYLGRTYDYDEMLKVPLIFHIPGSGAKETISTLGGQIDFLPTIANLLNLDLSKQPYVFGQDLVNTNTGFVAFTAYLLKGSFAKDDMMFEVSREKTFEGGRAWKRGTDEQLEIQDYKKYYKRAIAVKNASEAVLKGNLISKYVSHTVPEHQP